MQIVIETSMPLNETERKVLRLLLGEEEASPEPVKKAPAKKTAPKKEAPAKAETADPGALDKARDLATKMVATGRKSEAKQALTEVGARRVGELTARQAVQFLSLLGED